MQHPNQILSSEQIRRRLWESGSEPLSNIVAAQIRLLRRKLMEVTTAPLIETVTGIGYRFHATEER